MISGRWARLWGPTSGAQLYFHTEPSAAVRRHPILERVKVESEVLGVELLLLHARHQLAVAVLALASRGELLSLVVKVERPRVLWSNSSMM